MPPRPKITRDMIIGAGFDIVRSEGQESLNVRSIAAALECSTQPVMYHYSTVDALRADIYAKADEFHTNYIMSPDDSGDDPFLSIGIKYIRFAAEESRLFRFLFQSEKFTSSFSELMVSNGTAVIIQPMCQLWELSYEQGSALFEAVFVCAHGAASLIANNPMTYDEAHFRQLLCSVFDGVMNEIKGVDRNEKTF